MPRSWCYEVLWVKTDYDNNMYCERNSLGTGTFFSFAFPSFLFFFASLGLPTNPSLPFFIAGCNWRPADHRSRQLGDVDWFPIPSSWIGGDWPSLVYYDTHQDNCYPYCDRMKPKRAYLEDQDGQGCGY